jgi:uncharacterized protein (TIGR03382 family)
LAYHRAIPVEFDLLHVESGVNNGANNGSGPQTDTTGARQEGCSSSPGVPSAASWLILAVVAVFLRRR